MSYNTGGWIVRYGYIMQLQVICAHFDDYL